MTELTTKLNTEVQIIKSELANMKEANIESKMINTAEHLNIIKRLDAFGVKLDDAIACKADKDDLSTAQADIKGINQGLLANSRVAFYQAIGIIVSLAMALYAIKK